MAQAGGRPLLKERFEGKERLVPVAVALRASALIPFARYARDVALEPAEAIHEAIWLWCQREERRRQRHVRLDALQLLRRAEEWDPIGELIALADWQAPFLSDRPPVPIDELCRLTKTSRGNAIVAKLLDDESRLVGDAIAARDQSVGE